jgi:hypothetical protein
MPEISRFFGIIIRMYIEAGGPHHTPHFHAYYQDRVGIYGIDRIECLAVLTKAAGAPCSGVGGASPRRLAVELAGVAAGTSTR